MGELKINNKALEELIEVFRADKERESYVKVMELLEKSIVLVPTMQPEDLSPELTERMRAGEPVPLPKEAKVVPCLLTKDTGEQALPVFTSLEQIPPENKSPALIAIPFMSCVAMVTANQDKMAEVVVNPFTGMMILNQSILGVAEKRRQAVKTIQLTPGQFRDFAYNRVSLTLLPKYLFEQKEEGLKKLQQEEGAFLLQFLNEIYPEGKKSGCRAENFSLMILNLTDTTQLTRLDLPNDANKKGLCYRVYVVWKRDTEELLYYTLENTEDGKYIATITKDGKHELVEPVPDNGAEIEAIMNLL